MLPVVANRKHVNTLFSEEEHAIVAAAASSIGLTQSETVRRGFLFGNWVAMERVVHVLDSRDGHELHLAEILDVLFQDTQEVRHRFQQIDAFTTRLRDLEGFVKGVAEAKSGDLPMLKVEAHKLRSDGRWRAT